MASGNNYISKIVVVLETISPAFEEKVVMIYRSLRNGVKAIGEFFSRCARTTGHACLSVIKRIEALPRITKMFFALLTFLTLFVVWQFVAYSFTQSTFVTINLVLAAFLTGIAAYIVVSTQNRIILDDKRYSELQEQYNKLHDERDKLISDIYDMRSKERRQSSNDKARKKFIDAVRLMKAKADPTKEKYQYIIDALKKTFDISGAIIFARKDDESGLYDVAGRYALSEDLETTSVGPDDGIIGQVIKDGNPLKMAHVPSGYLSALSGLGRSNSLNVYVFPLKDKEGGVKAVLEAASFVKIAIWENWNDIETSLQEEI